MLNLYAFEETHRSEQQTRERKHLLRARWLEREPPRPSSSPVSAARRRLARALLLLADRLDPRAVVTVRHLPTAPALNGTMPHA